MAKRVGMSSNNTTFGKNIYIYTYNNNNNNNNNNDNNNNINRKEEDV